MSKRRYNRDKSCGYTNHDPECLCDVKPIGVEIGVADLVNDMFMGRQLCDIQGYCAPWTRNDILDYFQDLCKFYDAYAEQKKNPIIIGEFESQKLPEHVKHDKFGGDAQMRHYVRTVYNQFGRSMSDTLQQLGVSADEYRFALSRTRVGKYVMTMQMVDYLETELTKLNRPTLAEMSSAIKVPTTVIMAFAREVDERRKQLHGAAATASDAEALEMVKQLAEDTNLAPTAIVNLVFDRTGVWFNRSTPHQHRLRNGTMQHVHAKMVKSNSNRKRKQ
jgi:hypothetical protein